MQPVTPGDMEVLGGCSRRLLLACVECHTPTILLPLLLMLFLPLQGLSTCHIEPGAVTLTGAPPPHSSRGGFRSSQTMARHRHACTCWCQMPHLYKNDACCGSCSVHWRRRKLHGQQCFSIGLARLVMWVGVALGVQHRRGLQLSRMMSRSYACVIPCNKEAPETLAE